MAELEKVIKGLERCKLYNKLNCDKCPYDYNGRGNGKSECTAELASDVIELLKEQEAVEPTFKQDKDGIFVWACGSCGAYMYHIYDGIDKAKEYAKFCRQCGKAVRWE